MFAIVLAIAVGLAAYADLITWVTAAYIFLGYVAVGLFIALFIGGMGLLAACLALYPRRRR